MSPAQTIARTDERRMTMKCTRCGRTEVDGAIYCSDCGTSLVLNMPPEKAARAIPEMAAASPQGARGLAPHQNHYQDNQSADTARMDTQVQHDSSSQSGFIASLFDFRFNSFVTPRVVRVVYAIGMIIIGLSALGFLLFAFKVSALFGIISLCILCPLYFLLYLALWRIALELIMIIFRIGDDLRSIRDRRYLG
jgi:hypothetical protein